MIGGRIREFTRAAAKPIGAGLSVRCGQAGFFGELYTTLNGLRASERAGLDAKVRWGPTSQYFEASRGSNVWDYYFTRSEFPLSDREDGARIYLPYKPGAEAFAPYDGKNVRQSVAVALQKWCQPKPEILVQVDDFAQRHFVREKTLGVHVRLTDAAAGFENRRTVGLTDVFGAVDRWVRDNPEGGIFLATDDQRAIRSFEDRYPGRISFQDCLRSEDGTSIHGHYDLGVAGSPYAKGLEVMIDALLLSRCQHLVRTHSRVTCFTLSWNPGLTYTDLELELLGINRTPWLHQP